MDFHNILFPAPSNTISLNDFRDEIIFIPRYKEDKYSSNNQDETLSIHSSNKSTSNSFTKENLTKSKDSPKNYIPSLLLLTSNDYISKTFCIYFHGNAEDIFFARELADKIRFCFDFNILIVEYPGYSLYYDEKNCETVLENSLIVFDFLVEEMGISPQNILVIGRSIGTAPASYLCSKRNPEGVVLISPFISIRSIAEKLVGSVFKFLISEKFENINYVSDITCPVLFIHGLLDELIPFEHTLKLVEECKCPYEVLLPETMTHNDFKLEEDFLDPIKKFIRRFTRIKEGSYFSLNHKLLPDSYSKMPECIEEVVKKSGVINKGSFLSSCCQNS